MKGENDTYKTSFEVDDKIERNEVLQIKCYKNKKFSFENLCYMHLPVTFSSDRNKCMRTLESKYPIKICNIIGSQKTRMRNANGKSISWWFGDLSISILRYVLSILSGHGGECDRGSFLIVKPISDSLRVEYVRRLTEGYPSYFVSGRYLFKSECIEPLLMHLLYIYICFEKVLVLILAPSSLRLQWATVVLSQSGGSNRGGFTIVSSNTKGSIHLDGLFNIISYDLVPKIQNMLMASDFKVVIADESHFLKNAQAKRTTASLPVIKKAQYAILLSGTPALSRPIELFKQLEALHPDVYKNVHEYGNRYCKGGVFGVYQGASNHEELHNLMKATVMIRRLKKDVLSQLPVKRRQQVFLDLADKDMKQVNALFRELELVKAKIKASKSKDEVESLKFTQKNLINKIYTESAEAKIPAVLDYVGTVIEAGCKFLIFAHHQPMVDSIHDFLIKKKVGCIRIDGNTPPASRQAMVTDFQEKESIKAAVLSIKAGGVGLTLTAASTVIFAELSWTPGDLIQAEDRAHRIGQVSSVNIYYLLANDTVDDIIWDVVQSKLENLGQMLDGHENTMEVSTTQPGNSPAKQKTLDSYVRKCNNMDELEHHSLVKVGAHTGVSIGIFHSHVNAKGQLSKAGFLYTFQSSPLRIFQMAFMAVFFLVLEFWEMYRAHYHILKAITPLPCGEAKASFRRI
ncbi:SWI/SNF-related matrix-associated actin-dependent regulator of chromatin subfamily A-like protein 1 isoform X1 [Senna tora]|uniref:SWI/SNF-related matrix-associated actin-dependent regulator of chromatin subfamily A-like protein 1 isoform X1 n=1 Tax=Senna tora TaxID=362788 RepID=A0A834X4X7_9FABA|nr:SWI/SNF-related matrix-associated actin-dependent regulator of chromatin subfamily A-like protein 1 isoform X1 [Senna tora]